MTLMFQLVESKFTLALPLFIISVCSHLLMVSGRTLFSHELVSKFSICEVLDSIKIVPLY